MSLGAKIGIGVGVLVALGVIGAIAGEGAGEGDDSTESKPTASEQPKEPAAKSEKPADEKPSDASATSAAAEKKAPADEFKAFIKENGTPQQQEAAQHITRVQGADDQNDVLDSAEIHTDYTGGMTGPHSGDGKLLASAFADWRDSKNGLVTVYDSSGEILSNGKF
ncbi:hypothetical protein G5C65_26465 [Streptomyces sp. SB3404]|uniref:Uncharacterized protein n=2 Tax=Streptomyces boncukensis TaxID=2711219 RepID=A0A6G4X2R3_9ACTN|nr:hypothetical protein [Streptomyces boncukensis]NGO71829.1 hypothetical protein [Streptomyces boncukensis]